MYLNCGLLVAIRTNYYAVIFMGASQCMQVSMMRNSIIESKRD